MRRAKIVATIGPATESPEMLRALMDAGLDVVRINLSHGARDHHAEVIRRVREAAEAAGRPIAVMTDLAGPKIRTGRLAGGGPVKLVEGASIRLVPGDLEGTAEMVSITYERLAEEVGPGDRILVDDGLIELVVEKVEDGQVVARVVNGGLLKERKGVNLPGVKLSIPSITDKDRADLEAVLAAGVDYVALSFVRAADDCHHARQLVNATDPGVRLIAKIEKPEAIIALDEILAVVDGVMVARGDLGVEAPPEAVPVYQKRIIATAIHGEKPVITATQMLQSMVDQPRPTRAEASDVANAIFDGTDAVMLSNETAVGEFPVEAVATMDRIVRYAESSRTFDWAEIGQLLGAQTGSPGRALAEAAIFAAREIDVRTMVVYTNSGTMARHVASLRPAQRILALTPDARVRRQLALVWGVEPCLIRASESTDHLLADIDRSLCEDGGAELGETVLVLAGAPLHILKIHRVGETRN